ncbi:MAG TPA: alpha/beta hydrolase-fold protein [Anaerolineales bacterium]|nr:alpha/beta hydrolase-fold protein [Anaerolineales bacterium]
MMLTVFALLAFITACLPSNPPILPSTLNPPTATHQQALTPSPTADNSTAIPTQPACLTHPGRVEEGILQSTTPLQEFLIYLPPCYDEGTDHYPVLYLLHGQTYTSDQWIRLGAVEALDQLILSGGAQPLIIVFPQDRYWYTESGAGFGDQVVHGLIPYIDKSYRTIPDRSQRAIGGMSRGAGWALRLGLSNWDLFGIIGLHSLAILQEDGSRIERWLKDIPAPSYPIIFMDIGDNDPEFARAQEVESLLNDHGLSHEWHLYNGAHTEEYWQAHVQEYIEWYANQLKNLTAQ